MEPGSFVFGFVLLIKRTSSVTRLNPTVQDVASVAVGNEPKLN